MASNPATGAAIAIEASNPTSARQQAAAMPKVTITVTEPIAHPRPRSKNT